MKIGAIDNSGVLGRRDAIHVPVILAEATEEMLASTRVRFTDDSLTRIESCTRSKMDGIIDPFIKDTIFRGDKVNVFLCPEIVENLAHHFDVVIDGRTVTTTVDDDDDDDDDDGCRGCYS